MIRKYQILLIVFLLLIYSQVALADTNIQVSINGEKASVRQVPIIMDGLTVNTEFPSFVHGDRTLVPIRFVAENYDAQVDWERETRTVTVSHKGNQAIFQLDSEVAYINGQKMILDKNVIPRLVAYKGLDSRTMVPLRFISEIFGYEVGYDEIEKVPFINSKDKTIETLAIVSNISLNIKNEEVETILINSDKEIKFTTIYLKESKKLVIDMEETKLNIKSSGDKPGILDEMNKQVEKVQYSQFSYSPMITRAVITLKEELPYYIYSSKEGILITFDENYFANINKDENNEKNDNEGPIGGNSYIGKISSEIVNGRQALVVYGGGRAKINFMKLKNPERLVIDLLDSNLLDKSVNSYNHEIGFIKGVRLSQFSVDENYKATDQVVRIVLDIKEGVNDPSIKIETIGDNIVIYPEKDLWENISYNFVNDLNIFNIKNTGITSYDIALDESSKIIRINIPAEMSNLEEGIISLKDKYISEIQVEKDQEEVIMYIKFLRPIEYTVLSKRETDEISFMFDRIINTDKSNKLIVIDAGHGGRDPGASSVTKRTEKELNLSISLKLQRKLEDLGYSIIMTRDTDEYIDLYERARIANDSNADLFVSIHGNASTSSVHKGIQVLYCPAFDSEIKESDQHPFAKSIMEALLAGTGAIDKGIIQRPNLVVLRETKMPAVIVETGFISNPEEEKILYTEKYQDKIVESIVKGIEDYL